MKKKVCAVTGSRAEYGILYNTLKLIESSEDLELLLVVTGAHLSRDFGYTIEEIIKDDFLITEKVEMLVSSIDGINIGKSIGLGITGFIDCFKKLKPDIVLIVGDRYEILAVAVAAMAVNLPIAHISGGEITEGAIDEQIRHAITKMSHVHFTAIEENALRVKQMGEEDWRVHIVGGPWIDNIKKMKKISKDEIRKTLGMRFDFPTIIVTYHPVTLQLADTRKNISSLLSALDKTDAEIIFTYPNADSSGQVIISAIEKFTAAHSNAKVFKSLGRQLYLNVLSYVDLVIGNSSSGIVETQGFKVPVVNIGNRQKGRLITDNIICTGEDEDEILRGINKGLSKEFRKAIADMENPYDRGVAAKHIVRELANLDLGPSLLKKKFIFRRG